VADAVRTGIRLLSQVHHPAMAVVVLPDPSLVVLVGAAGSGKSTLASRHFEPAEILSSDAFRETIAGDAADQSASRAAFVALYAALERRLRAGRLTVVDATSLTQESRRALVTRATAAGIPATALVLDLAPAIVLARNAARHDRVVPEDVVRRHLGRVRRIVDEAALNASGFERVVTLRDPVDVDSLEIQRVARH
jgi:predicted kinase